MLNRLFASLLLLAVIAFTCVAQQEKTEPTKPGETVARLVGDVADTDLFAWYTIVRKKAKTESENP